MHMPTLANSPRWILCWMFNSYWKWKNLSQCTDKLYSFMWAGGFVEDMGVKWLSQRVQVLTFDLEPSSVRVLWKKQIVNGWMSTFSMSAHIQCSAGHRVEDPPSKMRVSVGHDFCFIRCWTICSKIETIRFNHQDQGNLFQNRSNTRKIMNIFLTCHDFENWLLISYHPLSM